MGDSSEVARPWIGSVAGWRSKFLEVNGEPPIPEEISAPPVADGSLPPYS